MIFNQNGVIRNLPKEKIENEIKHLLIGKTMHFKEESITVKDISIEGNYLLLHHHEGIYEISNVKKIEIDSPYGVIRIFSSNNHFIVSIQ